MSGWVSHFRLSGDPFSEDNHSWQLYYGGCYGVASLRLEQAITRQQGHVIVTGPAGTGKSALVRSIVGRIDAYATATISAAERAPAAVIEALLHSREPVDDGFSSTRRRAALLAMIEDAKRLTKPILCIVEDAHLARPGQLKDLISAVNIAPDAHQVLRLVLVGRPALIDTLEARSLAALRTRVVARIDSQALSREEIADYLADRLESAGAATLEELLPPAAIAAIANNCRGVIALCNTITRQALERAASSKTRMVSPELIDQVSEIYSKPEEARGLAHTLRTIPSVITSASVTGLIVLALIVAAAQVRMAGSDPMAVRVTHAQGERSQPALAALSGELLVAQAEVGTEAKAGKQRRSMREKFLAGTPYQVEIKPPPRPAPAAAPALPAPPAALPTVAAKVAPPPAASASPGGSVSLQVGAFRELRSAAELKARVQRAFDDVHISRIESGGEPLYRVRVGQFPDAEATEATKLKLQAAGYPSFRVSD